MASVLAPSSIISTIPPQTPDGGRRASRVSGSSITELTPAHNGGHTTSPKSYGGEGLLIPTDRDLDELEEKWLPALGRLRVEREVVLGGYALYALRSWVLSRTQWSQTIVTQTGKPSESITAYLLVPDHSLSHREGKHELSMATQLLASDTKAQARKTDHGTLLVTTPTVFGQDAFHIPGGDLRYARPFLRLNTDLRRLGCGGRSFGIIGAPPQPTLRRKFLDLYKLPTPPTPPGGSWSENAAPSPTRGNDINGSPSHSSPHTPTHTAGHPGTHAVMSDPFVLMVMNLVKLIQASLFIWGMYSSPSGSYPIDGFFCDETKAGLAEWRKIMGFDQDPDLQLDSQSSGSCIDTATLAALLSSITSSRYHLAGLGVEKVPKDPFAHPVRFLAAWRTYLISTGKPHHRNEFLSVAAIRILTQDFASDRSRSAGDTLKLSKLVSGVASATSQVSSTLKGGEDAPLRKREHHGNLRHIHPHSPGVHFILPDQECGPMAAPNIMTTNLEAFIAGITRSREKEWDIIGARRIALLWSGIVGPDEERRRSGRLPHLGGVLRRRTYSRDLLSPDEDESSAGPGGIGSARNTLREVKEKTGQVIREGIGLVSRRGTTYETSDSESGRAKPSRRRQQTVPTLVEPGLEEEENEDGASPMPSPINLTRRPPMANAGSARASFLTTASRQSNRPSINTAMSNDSDGSSRHMRRGSIDASGFHRTYRENRPITPDSVWDEAGPSRRRRLPSRDERALAWHDRGYDVGLLRTASDGADVTAEEDGLEWEVRNPHGTGKGHLHDMVVHEGDPRVAPIRRHSLEDLSYYRHMTLRDSQVPCDGADVSDHLSVDVDLCMAVLELRKREKTLARKCAQMKTLEESIFKASQDVIDAVRERRTALSKIYDEEDRIRVQLDQALEDLPYDEGLESTGRNMRFYTSEPTRDISQALRQLKGYWDEAKQGIRKAEKEVKEKAAAEWPREHSVDR